MRHEGTGFLFGVLPKAELERGKDITCRWFTLEHLCREKGLGQGEQSPLKSAFSA